ncbi:MAG: hypothetical protein KDE27_28645 [Planctomycetes bacterium]|nr:hypothetical protein [Planctomycetota bacterium]
MRRYLLLLALSWSACAAAPEPGAALDALALPTATRQVIFVTTTDWDATAAIVRRFERVADGWRAVGAPIAATVGRSGLAWGIGRHRAADGPQKLEGDGRAPAGVFELGPAFGYAPSPPPDVALPWRQATARDYWVDAPESPDYNAWRSIPAAEPNDPTAHWRSFERMRRDDALYEFGVVVDHNPERRPRCGSAIFLHVWSGSGRPTSGCTAMARDDLLTLLRWLRPESQPLMVQAPLGALGAIRL